MHFKIFSAILLSLGVNVWGQQVISDPIAEFLDRNPRYFNQGMFIEELYIVAADIDEDGQSEVFLSHQDMYVDRAGRAWSVYTPVDGGYRRVENVTSTRVSGEQRTFKGSIRFRTDAFHVGRIEGVEGTELFSYAPGGGQTGVIIGIWLEHNALVERKVRDMLMGPRGADMDFYKSLFVAGRGKLVKAKVEDLATEAQRMALIGGLPPELTGGFLSRTPEEPDAGHERSAVSSQEARPTADVPSIRAASGEELDEPAAVGAGQTEEPEGRGWPAGMLVVSICAVAFLLAFAGYRLFSKKGRSES